MKAGRKTIIIAVLLMAVLIAGGIALWSGRHAEHEQGTGSAEQKVQYTCGMHPFIIQDEPGLCPICGMKLTPMKPGAPAGAPAERTVRHWVSPMDPTYIRDEPGQDYMGHDLVPVYEGAAGQIVIDPVTMQNMGLRTEIAARRDLGRAIRTVGRVVADESRQYAVNSKIDGWIERLHVRETGRAVRRGEPLLEIYSPELVAAQQEFLLALRNRNALTGNTFAGVADGADRLLEAARTRLKFWDISERQIAELEKTGQVRKTMTLYSPFSGIVTEKEAFEGMRVMAGTDLFRLADLSRVWVLAEVYESDIPWLRPGGEGVVELSYATGRQFRGRIDYIYPYLQAETRTQQVRLQLDNPGMELKPEMYVNVHLEAQSRPGVLAVPTQAVLFSGTGQRVFVHLGEGRFEPRPVQVGLRSEDGWVEITSGLREGEIVVTSAQFMLDSESRLQEAIQKMMQPQVQEPPPAHENHEDLEELFR